MINSTSIILTCTLYINTWYLILLSLGIFGVSLSLTCQVWRTWWLPRMSLRPKRHGYDQKPIGFLRIVVCCYTHCVSGRFAFMRISEPCGHLGLCKCESVAFSLKHMMVSFLSAASCWAAASQQGSRPHPPPEYAILRLCKNGNRERKLRWYS